MRECKSFATECVNVRSPNCASRTSPSLNAGEAVGDSVNESNDPVSDRLAKLGETVTTVVAAERVTVGEYDAGVAALETMHPIKKPPERIIFSILPTLDLVRHFTLTS